MEVQTVPVAKAQWRDLVLRMRIPSQRKAVAFALAYFASEDGTRVFPGQQKVADMADMHETNARKHIKALLAAGMLKIVKRGGGRGGATTTYRLTRPADITTLPLWLDPSMNRVEDGTGFDSEHRASEPGVSVDNSPDEPVDNSETPSVGALHSDGPERETPSVSKGNTERSVQKHRALALPDHTMTTPLPHQHPAGLPNATPSLALVPPLHNDDEVVADPETPPTPIEIPGDADFDAARDTLADLPRHIADHWRRDAEHELATAGVRLDRRAVAIHAADLATRPTLANRTGTP